MDIEIGYLNDAETGDASGDVGSGICSEEPFCATTEKSPCLNIYAKAAVDFNVIYLNALIAKSVCCKVYEEVSKTLKVLDEILKQNLAAKGISGMLPSSIDQLRVQLLAKGWETYWAAHSSGLLRTFQDKFNLDFRHTLFYLFEDNFNEWFRMHA